MLIDEGVPLIFFPSVVFERKEFANTQNHYNCAIVQGYPTLLRNNIDVLRNGVVDYRYPVFDLSDEEGVAEEIQRTFADFGVTRDEARRAVMRGFEEQGAFNADIAKKGEETLELIKERGEHGVVLAGRPYHTDPEINHGIANILVQENFHVLTEDSVFHLGGVEGLRANNEWVYQTRLFAAADLVARSPDLELVELNSFGCGIDSITTDQVEEILHRAGKITTILKIDEIANLGAARIRIRSLKAAVSERKKSASPSVRRQEKPVPAVFTGKMAETHTILIPAMTPIREEGLLDAALEGAGYKTEYLTFNLVSADVGLQYVNNDFCHALIDYAGQIILALRSGKYDLNHVGVMMMESCSLSCRGSAYISVFRKALDDAGFPQVPVVSYRMWFKDIPPDTGENVGLQLTVPLLTRMLLANSYGELFERVVCRTRPYEIQPGQIDALHKKWLAKIRPSITECSLEQFNRNVKAIVQEFDNIPLQEAVTKPKIGLVGDSEVPFDYALKGANNLCRLLEAEGAEVVMGNFGYMGTSNFLEIGDRKRAAEYREICDDAVHDSLTQSKRFIGLCSILDMKEDAKRIAPFAYYKGNFLFGAGSRIIGLLKYGINDIVNFGAFNCTLNYVTGTGFHKEIKRLYPAANVVDIDFAQGIPAVNQINRIRLMMSRAGRA
jgi:predicted nucleotide-binding protein (sugar kinase/HSP70/actin superfamily)